MRSGERGLTDTSPMTDTDQLRADLLELLRGGAAHMTIDEAVADYPLEHINARPPNVTYTPWQLLEHVRLTQRDILDFVRESDYSEPRWPDDYWPDPEATADEAAWHRTVSAIREDLVSLQALVADPSTDLAAPVRRGYRQALQREVMLTADHNAYHVGEFAILRQVMGTWPSRRR